MHPVDSSYFIMDIFFSIRKKNDFKGGNKKWKKN